MNKKNTIAAADNDRDATRLPVREKTATNIDAANKVVWRINPLVSIFNPWYSLFLFRSI
jgi:hypothetical protein